MRGGPAYPGTSVSTPTAVNPGFLLYTRSAFRKSMAAVSSQWMMFMGSATKQTLPGLDCFQKQ
jgi:hypothetical protein